MLPAVSQPIIASTGGEHMQMGMVLAITPVRMEHGAIAPLKRLAPNGTVEVIQTSCPAAHERTQHDCRVLVEGRPEHRRHREDDMPIDHPCMEGLTDLTDPVVDVDFGAPQAQRRLATHCHQMLPRAAVQTAVFDVSDLFRLTTRQHLRHQTVVIGGLIPRMGVLKHLPVIGKDLLKDTPVPCGCCQHPSPPSERVVTVPWLYHVSSALSTSTQCLRGLLHSRGNCLCINHKK